MRSQGWRTCRTLDQRSATAASAGPKRWSLAPGCESRRRACRIALELAAHAGHSGSMAATKCWSLLVGSRRLAGQHPAFSRRDDKLLQRITAAHFPSGHSILQAAGGWYDAAARRFVREESRQVLICAASAARVRAWGRDLGTALRQKELLIVEHGRALALRITRPARKRARHRSGRRSPGPRR